MRLNWRKFPLFLAVFIPEMVSIPLAYARDLLLIYVVNPFLRQVRDFIRACKGIG